MNTRMQTLTQVAPTPFLTPAPRGTLQRKCACGTHTMVGGQCADCAKKKSGLQRLAIGASNDPLEQEADRVAEQVIVAPVHSTVSWAAPRIQRFSGHATGKNGTAPASVDRVLASAGRSLDPTLQQDMGQRFGYDFSQVRVHTGTAAEQSARDLNAKAYTAGRDIVFGTGAYAFLSRRERRLLAHELTHVVQQHGTPSSASSANVIQRAPTISILDENFIGPPSLTQRRAARSCPITCCDNTLGTQHTMPLFFHQSRRAQVPARSAAATGIGAAIHFIASGTQPTAGDLCHCDDFRIIQVLETTDPAPGRGGNSYVDNSGRNTPFYSDVFLGGRGEHEVPAGYPDASERLTTTESIYDRPYRDPAALPAANLSWMAEACVACVKNNEADRVLGCTTYGFTRTFNTATRAFGPVVSVGPGCLDRPTQHFINTLRNDPTTSSYEFKAAPNAVECAPRGDFPMPQGDTRLA